MIVVPAVAQSSVPFTQLIAEGYNYTVVAQGALLMRKENTIYICLASQTIEHPVTLRKMQEHYRAMECAPVD
jgi:hypothetical protein